MRIEYLCSVSIIFVLLFLYSFKMNYSSVWMGRLYRNVQIENIWLMCLFSSASSSVQFILYSFKWIIHQFEWGDCIGTFILRMNGMTAAILTFSIIPAKKISSRHQVGNPYSRITHINYGNVWIIEELHLESLPHILRPLTSIIGSRVKIGPSKRVLPTL